MIIKTPELDQFQEVRSLYAGNLPVSVSRLKRPSVLAPGFGLSEAP
jgi:hypothetical protein